MTGEIYDDFAVADGWPGEKWIKHHLWEPAATIECPGRASGTLTIEASPFTISCPPHHVKVLTLSTTAFAPPDHGWIRFEVQMAAATNGTERNPLLLGWIQRRPVSCLARVVRFGFAGLE